MGTAAAKQGDLIQAMDTHLGPSGSPIQTPFFGLLQQNLSSNVRISGAPAATVGSQAQNTPAHVGITDPASNLGSVWQGSGTVRINGRPAARDGDVALTCNVGGDAPVGRVIAAGSVRIG